MEVFLLQSRLSEWHLQHSLPISKMPPRKWNWVNKKKNWKILIANHFTVIIRAHVHDTVNHKCHLWYDFVIPAICPKKLKANPYTLTCQTEYNRQKFFKPRKLMNQHNAGGGGSAYKNRITDNVLFFLWNWMCIDLCIV